jgi:hypothetical protein
MRAVGLLAILVAGLAALGAACGRPSSEASPVASAKPPPGTLALGERITSPIVPLATIAKDPGNYRNRVIATTGRVTSVCREMGCWLEIQDESGQAHVKIHGHSFFVPRTSPGHVARVQATVVDAPANALGEPRGHGAADQDHCEDTISAQSGMAKIVLDATGVEID